MLPSSSCCCCHCCCTTQRQLPNRITNHSWMSRKLAESEQWSRKCGEVAPCCEWMEVDRKYRSARRDEVELKLRQYIRWEHSRGLRVLNRTLQKPLVDWMNCPGLLDDAEDYLSRLIRENGDRRDASSPSESSSSPPVSSSSPAVVTSSSSPVLYSHEKTSEPPESEPSSVCGMEISKVSKGSITLRNASSSKTAFLGGWSLRQMMAGRCVAQFQFPPRTFLPPLASVKIKPCSALYCCDGCMNPADPASNTDDLNCLTFINTTGPVDWFIDQTKYTTALCDKYGKAVAWTNRERFNTPQVSNPLDVGSGDEDISLAHCSVAPVPAEKGQGLLHDSEVTAEELDNIRLDAYRLEDALQVFNADGQRYTARGRDRLECVQRNLMDHTRGPDCISPTYRCCAPVCQSTASVYHLKPPIPELPCAGGSSQNMGSCPLLT